MSDAAAHDLVERVKALLRPGSIDLAGMIVHTGLSSEDELELHEVTIEVGEIIAAHAGVSEWYVYSGNDSPKFGLNQHQALRIEDDAFVWECQQLLRDGTFEVVMYYESSVDQEALIHAVEDVGYRVTSVQVET